MTKSELKKKGKLCKKCLNKCSVRAKSCSSCGSEKFEPDWILVKERINRSIGVQITKPNPEYSKENRITLSKWWPGAKNGGQTFHIARPGDWEQIEYIINDKFLPLLGWKSKKQLVEQIAHDDKQGENSDGYMALAKSHPDFLKKLVAAIDPKDFSENEFNSMVDVFGEISDAMTKANRGFREAFLNVVKKLPKQKTRALEDLNLLLENWGLQVVTNVAQQVQNRIETLELFEDRVLDDKTHEIIGVNSIHRILERSMWMIDEKYWLLQSNKTLLTYIGKELSKKDKKKYGKKRPDFVCGTIGKKLIIVELKRPSHPLNVEDLNQLEDYSVIIDKYKGARYSVECFLVGSKKDSELDSYLKRRKGVSVLTYDDIISNTRTRYQEYLKSLHE